MRKTTSTIETNTFKYGAWTVLEGINASYNPETKRIVFNIMGEGFSMLATKDMQEFLESVVPDKDDA